MNIEEAAKAAGLKVGTNIGGVTLVGSPLPQSIAHITIEEMERFAKIIRNQALEEAANLFLSQDRFSAAGLIRAMKEQT